MSFIFQESDGSFLRCKLLILMFPQMNVLYSTNMKQQFNSMLELLQRDLYHHRSWKKTSLCYKQRVIVHERKPIVFIISIFLVFPPDSKALRFGCPNSKFACPQNVANQWRMTSMYTVGEVCRFGKYNTAMGVIPIQHYTHLCVLSYNATWIQSKELYVCRTTYNADLSPPNRNLVFLDNH